jgi:hypothetical protein
MITVFKYVWSYTGNIKDKTDYTKYLLLTLIKDIQDKPERRDGYPVFCTYPASFNWGLLGKTFRFVVNNLKARMAIEIRHIMRDTLFFRERLPDCNLKMMLTPSLSIIPAFKYVEEIDTFPFFEYTYLLFLKARTGERLGFMEEKVKTSLYKQWHENAEKMRNDFFNDDTTFS